METKNIFTGLTILIVGFFVAFVAYQNSRTNQSTQIENIGIEYEISTPTASQINSNLIPTETAELSTASSSATPTPKNTNSETEINIAGEFGIPSYWRSELQKKILNPVVDYYKMHDQGKLNAININTNTQTNRNIYPYIAELVLESGAKIGFVIEKTDSSFKWWTPECLGGCNYSENFATKYPEIIAN